MISNIYTELTRDFNKGKVRSILCSGQAVVLHGLAVMSKDGDWIIRSDEESLNFILSVLASKGAVYRYGAPLASAWLEGGWSTHLEYTHNDLRIRTDFFTKPPRLNNEQIADLWQKAEAGAPQYVDLETLALLKQTDREKDYVILGELARKISDVREMLKYSRSAVDILNIWDTDREIIESVSQVRPVLKLCIEGRDALEAGLDAERRTLMRINSDRLLKFKNAATKWAERWSHISAKIKDLPLLDAHQIMVSEASKYLPTEVRP